MSLSSVRLMQWLDPVRNRYENGDPVVRFTEAQLGEIRKATVAKVLCDNGDIVESIQRRAFDIADPFQ